MSETKSVALSGVAETLLITLYIRAMESQRLDALIKDRKAVELVTRKNLDFTRVKQIPLSEANKLVIILRTREFDHYAQDFLARHPEAVVVHIGCGLDSRFERVAEGGRVEWYDLDFPNVIELRRKFIGDEKERYHLLGCSVLDNAWLDMVSAHQQPPSGTQSTQRPFLFLAEGISMHLKEAQVKSLVLTLRDHFPGAELVFDAYSPIHLLVSNLQTARAGFRCHWGLWHGQEIEGWGDPSTSLRAGGIRLLDEWGYFDGPEPRLASIWWIRPFEPLFRTLRIYHFQLGKAAG
jgi:O-methyltransferase involved in polyketide biosynthesis